MDAKRRRTFETIAVGDRLPCLEFDANLTALVMYAGATWDFHRYHYDASYVAKRGIPAPFMDGQLAGALLARLLMAWGGPDAFVRRLGYRLRTMVFAGDRILVSGEVVETTSENGRKLATCKLDIVKANGKELVCEATAVVELVATVVVC
jgi:acyl dehydratase